MQGFRVDTWLVESQKDDQFDGQELEQWPMSPVTSELVWKETLRDIMSNDKVELNESIGGKSNADNLYDWKPGVSECQAQTFGTKQVLSLEDNRSDTDRS